MAAGGAGAARLSRDEGLALAAEVLRRHGFSSAEAATIANHLVEAELRGRPQLGLRRLAAITRMAARGRAPVRIVREGPAFAHLDGGGNPASLAGEQAVRIAIDKARASSLAMVALYNSAQGGVSGHYVRLAAQAGFVGALFSSSYGRVAPHGGADPLIGTNPIAFGFPAEPAPIVIDIATSAINNGDVEVALTAGEALPQDVALDASGRPTRDAAAAIAGALRPFAGHKGYGLGLAMQLFGMLAGGDAVPENLGNFGFVFLVVDPVLFGPADEFRARATAFAETIRSSRRAVGADEILLPGEGGERRRAASLSDGFAVDASVLAELRAL